MAFSIQDAFHLVFGSEDEGGYDERRWFRKPDLLQGAEAADNELAQANHDKEIASAETFLSSSISASIRKWDASADDDVVFDARLHLPPRTPFDVFAISAYLMEHAGIYHHLQPAKKAHPVNGDPDARPGRHLAITQADRDQVRQTADAWRELDADQKSMGELADLLVRDETWEELEPLFESWWMVFGSCGAHQVAERPRTDDGSPNVPVWWKHAWRLLAIADEAARGTCFNFDIEGMRSFSSGKPQDIVWFEGEIMMELVVRALDRYGSDIKDGEKAFSDIKTLSAARTNVVNVLPKVRTPGVGCTLRSVSHHLALLPPQGVVKGRWTPNYTQRAKKAGDLPRNTMNLIVVPMPFSVNARTFRPTNVEDVSDRKGSASPKIGYFDVAQDWLEDQEQFADFIEAIIESASMSAPEIHGMVFPELALTYDAFNRVREIMRDRLPNAELLIGGTATDENGQRGNFVAASTFKRSEDGLPVERETVREKHHRWKLDALQLRDYGLHGALSPELEWWEDIDLRSRQVDFTAMRKDSVFAAMICEDLARVDPCQQIIRAIGPNLVVALLMDAPQIEARWPARYATVLAEDPGCAVLTLTSRGLMTLQHRTGTFRSSGDDRTIALWRNDGASRPVTITCPYDAQGVILTIRAGDAKDISLDGRVDDHAKAWRYAGHMPVRLTDAKKKFAKVLGAEDLACW